MLEYCVACYLFNKEVFTLSKFGHDIRILHWCTDQAVTGALAQMDLTAAQGPILGYLSHRKTPPCSRDIEGEFHLSHPTVSGLLTRLEKKGFIEIRTDEEDRRCKRIFLLEKGRQCNDRIHRTICAAEARMLQGFTEEEKALFDGFLKRAIANMGGAPCRHHHNEEE